ncbi:MAG: HEAT repeat domain-containing protein [Rickettsiales bacterium]
MTERDAASYIWTATAILSLSSLVIFAALIGLRFLYDKRRDETQKRKEEMKEALLAHLHRPLKNVKTALVRCQSDMDALADMAIPLLHELKGKTCERLKETLRGVGAYDRQCEHLRSLQPFLQIRAARFVAHWPDDAPKKALCEMTTDLHPHVRHAALEALARLQDAEYFVPFIEEMRDDASCSPLFVGDMLCLFGPFAVSSCAGILADRSMPPRMKIGALAALAQKGAPEDAVLAARPLCGDADREVRAAAFKALRVAGRLLDAAALEVGAKDSYWRVRQYVAECAAHVRPFPLGVLTTLTGDANWMVGLAAGRALCEYGAVGKERLRSIANKNPLVAHRAHAILAECDVFGGRRHGVG